jgi:hypothetical protein
MLDMLSMLLTGSTLLAVTSLTVALQLAQKLAGLGQILSLFRPQSQKKIRVEIEIGTVMKTDFILGNLEIRQQCFKQNQVIQMW